MTDVPLTVESVIAQEEACRLPSFDSNVAWEIGSTIRKNIQQKYTRSAMIYIALANSSQLLFFASSGPGTFPDNMLWVKRKEAVVLRWGRSTIRMGLWLQEMGITLELLGVSDSSTYSVGGGGFPVTVKGVEGVVGVIVVSGLAPEDDHAVIVDGIQEYLAKKL